MSNPLESWTEEQRSALLYRTCAEAENDSARAELFRRLARSFPSSIGPISASTRAW